MEQVKLNKLLGTTEIAALVGVSTQAVSNWRARHADFPKPIAELAMGPVFDEDEIRSWTGVHKINLLPAVQFPLEAEVVLHRNRDDGYMQAEDLNLPRGACQDEFARAGYEVAMAVSILQDGTVMAHAVNGVALTQPVRI